MRKNGVRMVILGVFLAVWVLGARAASTRVYVTEAGGAEGRDGTSWARAYASEDLRGALAAAGANTEIWVAKGTYRPASAPGDRDASFVLRTGVTLYGGFAGNETTREQRDPATQVTILSGNLGDPAASGDNGYHVVTGGGADATAVLDGFTVSGGWADGGSERGCGGGLYNDGSSAPTVRGCTFEGNTASRDGGGVYNASFSRSTLTDCVFRGNHADGMGGGLFSGYNGAGDSRVTGCTFEENEASYTGGGLYAQRGVAVRGCTFARNRSQFGGAMTVVGFGAAVNCTFSDNVADRGGGLYASSSCAVTNCTFSGNTAKDSGLGGALSVWAGSPSVTNCVFWGESGGEIYVNPGGGATPAITYCVVQGGLDPASDGTNHILSGDPKLLGPTDLGGGVETYALQVGSSAIDAGTASGAPDTDQRGASRPYPVGGSFDIGAFEYGAVAPTEVPLPTVTPTPEPSPTPAPKRVYVTEAGGTEGRDGTSWARAYASEDLRGALAAASAGTEIWVARGTYRPTLSGGRTLSFALKTGVALYGGFAGDETARDQRDPAAQVTILSGNVGTLEVSGDNSYHVVTGGGTDATAILDGFTVTEGRADGGSPPQCFGGGLYVHRGAPTVTDCVFEDNTAGFDGAGVYNDQSAPALTRCVFRNNRSDLRGGGLFNNGADSRPAVKDCLFEGNSALLGGGMYNSDPVGDGGLRVSGCTFAGNAAVYLGGGLYDDGSAPELIDCTFSGNTAGSAGGGLYSYNDNDVSSLVGCTLADNVSAGGDGSGGGLYEENGGSRVTDCIFWNGAGGEIGLGSSAAPTIVSCVVRGGLDPATDGANHILSGDPRLMPLADNGGFTETRAIRGDSSARDAGAVVPGLYSDQRGVLRPQGEGFDIGAYEYDPAAPPDPTSTPAPTAAPTSPPGATPTSGPAPTSSPGGPTPTPGGGTPTGGPLPSGILTPTPIPPLDPAVPLPWIWISGFEGGTSLASSDVVGLEVSRDVLSSNVLTETLLRVCPEAVASGDYDIGLVRRFDVVATLPPGASDLTFHIRFTYGATSSGYASEVLLLLRTFDGRGHPTGWTTANAPGDRLDPEGGTRAYLFAVRDGGETDGDGVVDGRVLPQVAAVVVTYREAGAIPAPSSLTPGSGGGGGGCALGLLPVPLLLGLPLLFLFRKRR